LGGVVCAEGPDFTAGMNLPRFFGPNAENWELKDGSIDVLALKNRCRKPIVTAVQGIVAELLCARAATAVDEGGESIDFVFAQGPRLRRSFHYRPNRGAGTRLREASMTRTLSTGAVSARQKRDR
jgi:hypothetical protein